MEPNKNPFSNPAPSQEFNLKKVLSSYTKKWLWFVFSLLIALAIAYIYIRYTTPQYEAYAKVKIVSENEGTSANAVFKDLPMFSDAESARIEDEVAIITSRKTLEDVIDKLDLNVQYFVQGRVYESELYDNPPFNINFIESDSLIKNSWLSFNVEVLSDVDFEFKINNEDISRKKSFGEKIETRIGGIVITPKGEDVSSFIGKEIRVEINPISSLVPYYKSKILLEPIEVNSRIIRIAMQDPVKSRAIDFINTLIDTYNKNTILEKNIKSKNTADFIDARIKLIEADLAEVDDVAESYKASNKLTDIGAEANLYLGASTQSEQELNAIKNELNTINFMKGQLGGADDAFEPLPSNLGLSDGSVGATAAKYNELLSVRQTRLKSSSEKNPIIVNLDQQLNTLRNSLKQSLDNSAKAVRLRMNSVQSQLTKINSKLYSVPGQTRELRDIEREQGTKEQLYLYLLEKREEATISLTATSPNAVVVERAYSYPAPISPDKDFIYIASVFLGLLIPFGVIYVRDLLDNKIHNREDLAEAISDITILGELPRLKNADKAYVKRNDRSLLSESFRIIRTNFDYVRRARNVKAYDNVVFVTSTVNGEGKSFFSTNFALTLANTNKRVLLVGADIRNPNTNIIKSKMVSGSNSQIGLTEYLNDESVQMDDIINTYDLDGNKMDMILAGKIPPNPAELLMSDRMKPLFDQVSVDYDFVIVDTAPSMLVTDTLLISQYAGHTIYLTRGGYTEKSILNFTKDLHEKNKLNGMMLVVNDVDQANFGYGARYGYYGPNDNKGLFKRLFS
ncbi:polysaccharide biosynthesis tyrosine autokinase [Flavobacteriaceae bacterium GSB9]|nr:polysaccharide biosynthesis tyrosine autokinase [Flavobacteriaceae bacterium GSB9]